MENREHNIAGRSLGENEMELPHKQFIPSDLRERPHRLENSNAEVLLSRKLSIWFVESGEGHERPV